MKVAVISQGPCFPPDRGNRRRNLNLIRALRQLGHDVTFISLAVLPPEALRAHQGEFGPGRFRVLEPGLPCQARQALRRLASRASGILLRAPGGPDASPHGLDDLFCADFVPRLQAAQARDRFEAVFVEYLQCSRALLAFGPEVLKVLYTHDSFVDRNRLSGVSPGALHYTRAEQVRGFRRADAVVAIQGQEHAEFQAALAGSGVSCHLVSHILEPMAPLAPSRTAGATFLGSGHPMNREALAHFLKEVLPPCAPGCRNSDCT